jgi:hypothetical protein
LNQDDLLNIAALLHLRDLVIQTRQVCSQILNLMAPVDPLADLTPLP